MGVPNPQEGNHRICVPDSSCLQFMNTTIHENICKIQQIERSHTCDPCGKMILMRLVRQGLVCRQIIFLCSNQSLSSFSSTPPQCPFKSLWSLSIQTWLWSHTADILSALYCCHTQWRATIRECERDPAHCVPNIFSAWNLTPATRDLLAFLS